MDNFKENRKASVGRIGLKTVMSCLLLILFSKNAISDVNETGEITRIIAEGSTMISVWLNGPDETSECSGRSRWTIRNNDPLNADLFKEKVSILLAAATSGKTVHLHHLTSWGCGNWDSNKIYYVDISY